MNDSNDEKPIVTQSDLYPLTLNGLDLKDMLVTSNTSVNNFKMKPCYGVIRKATHPAFELTNEQIAHFASIYNNTDEGDGYDLFHLGPDVILKPGEQLTVHTGISIETYTRSLIGVVVPLPNLGNHSYIKLDSENELVFDIVNTRPKTDHYANFKIETGCTVAKLYLMKARGLSVGMS